jgi:acetyl esterase/lipase
LDIYYPPSSAETPRPVLFWSYGGGTVSGDRILANTEGLVYANVGSFFARKEYVVVIPDYRLVPAVKFPAPSEDIRDAMIWITEHAGEVGTAGTTLDTDTLIVMGHSAGAINISSLYFHPELLTDTDLLKRTKAMILQGGTFTMNDVGVTSPFPPQVIGGFYGSLELQKKHDPIALFNTMSSEKVKALPPILLVEAEKEPAFIPKTGELLKEALEKADDGRKVGWIVAQGHNHISVSMALGTDDGEEWAEEVAVWLSSILA